MTLLLHLDYPFLRQAPCPKGAENKDTFIGSVVSLASGSFVYPF